MKTKRYRWLVDEKKFQPTDPTQTLLHVDQFIPSMLPMGKSTWWKGVKSGRYPRGIKLGPKITVWRLSDILGLLDSLQKKEPSE